MKHEHIWRENEYDGDNHICMMEIKLHRIWLYMSRGQVVHTRWPHVHRQKAGRIKHNCIWTETRLCTQLKSKSGPEIAHVYVTAYSWSTNNGGGHIDRGSMYMLILGSLYLDMYCIEIMNKRKSTWAVTNSGVQRQLHNLYGWSTKWMEHVDTETMHVWVVISIDKPA